MPPVERPRQGGAPMLRRTGQAWKLRIWLVLVGIGGGITLLGGQGLRSSWGPALLFGGMLLSAAAFAWEHGLSLVHVAELSCGGWR